MTTTQEEKLTLTQIESFLLESADMDEATHQKVLDLVRELVNKFEKSAKIVGFFRKENEKKDIKREIKRAMDDLGFKDRKLINVVQERFIDLGKVKFK